MSAPQLAYRVGDVVQRLGQGVNGPERGYMGWVRRAQQLNRAERGGEQNVGQTLHARDHFLTNTRPTRLGGFVGEGQAAAMSC